MPRPIDKFPGDWSRPLSVDRPVADRIEAGRASQARREAREAMERWESSPVADREPLSAEEERDLREWVANVEPKSTPTEIARLLATLDAARAHPDDEAWQWVAEHYPKVMVEMPTDLFRKLDAARAHPDEAGLREAYRRYAESAEGAGSVHSPVVQRLVEAVFDHIEAALAQPAVPVAGAEDWYDRDAKAFARAHAQTGALRAAQPEDEGLDRSGVDDVGEGLDAAWKEAEAALPTSAAMVRLTWRIGMHEKFPPDEDFEARAEWWEGNDRLVDSAFANSPAAALRALSVRLAALTTTQPERRDS